MVCKFEEGVCHLKRILEAQFAEWTPGFGVFDVTL